jgi:hypothetical protein
LANQDKQMANSIPLEMQSITRRAAEPYVPGDSIKAQINRAARSLGLNYRRARTFWYAATEAVRAEEADALRQWHRQWVATRIARLETELQQLGAEWQKMGRQREEIVLSMGVEVFGEAGELVESARD